MNRLREAERRGHYRPRRVVRVRWHQRRPRLRRQQLFDKPLLHGDLVDQIFADETATEVLWALADNQGTVRDVANYDPTLDTSSILNHRKFDAYGNITAESNANIDFLLAYTGAYLDPDTGLQLHGVRWYDPRTGRWKSEDPIRFAAGDANLNRYVGNSTTNLVDPSGLAWTAPPATAPSAPGHEEYVSFQPSSGKSGKGPTPGALLRKDLEKKADKGKKNVSKGLDQLFQEADKVKNDGQLPGTLIQRLDRKQYINTLQKPDPAWKPPIANSRVLRRKLQEGNVRFHINDNAHHIVPGKINYGGAPEARQLLETYQIDMNQYANGLKLTRLQHQKMELHSEETLKIITQQLQNSVKGVKDWPTGRQNILDELWEISTAIWKRSLTVK